MSAVRACAICRRDPVKTAAVAPDISEIRCDLCGTYRVTGSADEVLASGQYNNQRWILAGLVRTATAQRQVVLLTSDNIESLIASAPFPRTPTELSDNILLWLSRQPDGPTDFFGNFKVEPSDYPLFYLDSPSAFHRAISTLASLGYLQGDLSLISSGGAARPWDLRLTMAGWERIDALRRSTTDSWRAFVAMAFREDTLPAYVEGIAPALKATGYEPFRVDLVEHPGKIDDRIMSEIRRSGLLVADFTHHRGGVYFEAGVAVGRGIPVIWSCRKDHFAELHFDTRQYNHIEWSTPTELRVAIENRIRANFPVRPSVA